MRPYRTGICALWLVTSGCGAMPAGGELGEGDDRAHVHAAAQSLEVDKDKVDKDGRLVAVIKPDVPGVDTRAQCIFEYDGWKKWGPWPGSYYPDLKTPADVARACAGQRGGCSPARIGGHGGEVLTLIGCDPAATPPTVDAGVVACLKGLKAAHIILDGCNLGAPPRDKCSQALADATGIPVVAANVCVSSRPGDGAYSALWSSGEWLTFRPAPPPPPPPPPKRCGDAPAALGDELAATCDPAPAPEAPPFAPAIAPVAPRGAAPAALSW